MLPNAYDKKSNNHNSETLTGENAANDINQNAAVRTAADPPRFIAPTHGGVDILKLLTELEDLVENTPHAPFGTLLRFDEDKFHMTIMKIRANLPEEMKRASKLARDSERIVEEARDNAGRVVEDARTAALAELEKGKADAARMREEAKAEIAQRLASGEQETAHFRAQAEQDAAQMRTEAESQAAEIVASARAKGEGLVSDSEIVRQAQARAQELQTRTEQEAAAMRRGAEDYARDVLTNLEDVLGKTVVQIQRGRDLLERSH